MSEFRLTIDTSGVTFGEGDGSREIAGILEDVAARLKRNGLPPGLAAPIRDFNGNACGTFEYVSESPIVEVRPCNAVNGDGTPYDCSRGRCAVCGGPTERGHPVVYMRDGGDVPVCSDACAARYAQCVNAI